MAGYKTELSLCVDCCNCNKLVITDESIIPNDTVGHDVFGYRKIVVNTPNNTYIYSTLAGENPDEAINVLSVGGVNTFNYEFQGTDTDGIYQVTLYNFPLWNDSVLYSKQSSPIVFIGGNLYRCKESNTNVDPSTDTSHTYWEDYSISADTLKTRYARESKKVVLCISLISCYENKVKEALCNSDGSCSENLCDDKNFSQAMKISLLRKAICISEEEKDWKAVENQIEIFKSLCCDSCC